MMNHVDAVRFVDRSPNGAARVKFPTLIGCPRCYGLIGIKWDNDGEPEITYDPELACFVSAVIDGYNLSQNEITAARGGFAGCDGHECWPEDWQCAIKELPCTCGESFNERGEAK